MLEAITKFLGTTGIAKLAAEPNWWQYLVMYVIIGALFYLAIVKKFGIPIKWVGVGEGIDDLEPFDVKEFVENII